MKKITPDFFKEYVNTTDMQYNGNDLFSFVRYDTVFEEDKYVSNLWLFDMNTNTVPDSDLNIIIPESSLSILF